MYAVVPLKTCPHLSSLRFNEAPNRKILQLIFFNIIQIIIFNFCHLEIKTTTSCQSCESPLENWICLMCYHVYCGRYIMEHMLYHHLETDHPLTMSFNDLSVWCYKCEAYIDNPVLFKYKNLAHNDKFGEEMTWSYGSDSIVLEGDF